MMSKRLTITALVWALVWSIAWMPAAMAEEKMVELKLELPRWIPFEPWPCNFSPNVEKEDIERPPVMVPEGLVDLSRGMPVTFSGNKPIIGCVQQIVDGEKESYEGSYVEIRPSLQWVQVDLGEECEIYAIVVWHYFGQRRAYRDVVIQVAGDAAFCDNVRTVFNNDRDDSAGLGIGEDNEYIETNKGRCVGVQGARARYVRLYSNGNYATNFNHYTEVEVYGRPAG